VIVARYSPAVRPLVVIVVGFGLAVLDFHIEALDLLSDGVGWAIVAVGAARLGLVAAARLAFATGVFSLTHDWLSFRYVWINPVTGEEAPGSVAGETGPVHLRYDDVTGWQLAAMTLAMVLAAWTVWTLLGGLAGLAATGRRETVARQLRAARWAILATWTVPFVVAVAHAVAVRSGEFDPVWNGPLAYTSLAAVAVFTVVSVVLLREHDRSWAVAPRDIRPHPWDERRWGRSGRETSR
jgi:hypothetical protein